MHNANRDKIPILTRRLWRNRISAQQSRLKKKYEVKFLNQIIGTKDKGISDYLNIVARTLNPELLVLILKKSQKIINPVDNQALDEFKKILLEEKQDLKRIEVQKFQGNKISNEEFVSQAKVLLQTS